jgi:hypothetical protein
MPGIRIGELEAQQQTHIRREQEKQCQSMHSAIDIQTSSIRLCVIPSDEFD